MPTASSIAGINYRGYAAPCIADPTLGWNNPDGRCVPIAVDHNSMIFYMVFHDLPRLLILLVIKNRCFIETPAVSVSTQPGLQQRNGCTHAPTWHKKYGLSECVAATPEVTCFILFIINHWCHGGYRSRSAVCVYDYSHVFQETFSFCILGVSRKYAACRLCPPTAYVCLCVSVCVWYAVCVYIHIWLYAYLSLSINRIQIDINWS